MSRQHLIPFTKAHNLDDADMLAPEWCNFIVETDNGYLCLEDEPEDDVWSGRDHL